MNYLTLCGAFLMLFLTSSVARSFVDLPPLPPIDAYKVIQVSGEDVPQVVGVDIAELSVAAVIDGVLEPIPFQVDEYNQGGALL